jgi:hypothetical protein
MGDARSGFFAGSVPFALNPTSYGCPIANPASWRRAMSVAMARQSQDGATVSSHNVGRTPDDRSGEDAHSLLSREWDVGGATINRLRLRREREDRRALRETSPIRVGTKSSSP